MLSLVLAAAAFGFYAVQWRLRLAQLDAELAEADAVVARLMPLELDEELDLAGRRTRALEDIVVPGRPVAVFDAAGARLSGEWDGLPVLKRRQTDAEAGPTTARNTRPVSFRALGARHGTRDSPTDRSRPVTGARGVGSSRPFGAPWRAGLALRPRCWRRAAAGGSRARRSGP